MWDSGPLLVCCFPFLLSCFYCPFIVYSKGQGFSTYVFVHSVLQWNCCTQKNTVNNKKDNKWCGIRNDCRNTLSMKIFVVEIFFASNWDQRVLFCILCAFCISTNTQKLFQKVSQWYGWGERNDIPKSWITFSHQVLLRDTCPLSESTQFQFQWMQFLFILGTVDRVTHCSANESLVVCL